MSTSNTKRWPDISWRWSYWGLAALVLFLSLAIYWRVAIFSGNAGVSFARILIWQAITWFPWLILLFAAGGRVRRGKLPARMVGIGWWQYGVAAIMLAGLHILWFKTVSGEISPFLAFETTRYGVFQWFFIFWFFLDLVIFGLLVLLAFNLGMEGRFAAMLDDSKSAEPNLLIGRGENQAVVRTGEIDWIEAQDYYARVHLADGRKPLIRASLKRLEEQLAPYRFIRVHRSALVNLPRVEAIVPTESGSSAVRLKGGEVVPLSKVGLKRLRARAEVLGEQPSK